MLISNIAVYLKESKVSDKWKNGSRRAAAVMVD
jgi:hypothetical protein